MDFRSSSNIASTRLAVPSTILTPQLENYDLYHGYRELPTSFEGSQPFMLAFNLASVMEDELKIKRINKSASQDKVILQVEVAHKRKEAEGVHPFARNCSYRIELPEDLHDKNLTALWTDDHHLIVVESSNFIEVLTQAEEVKDLTDVDTQVELAVSVIIPRKVNCVFKPTANVDIMRQGVAISELGLFNVKRIIQNGSFTYPDIGRPRKKKFNAYTVEKKTEVVPFEGFFIKVIKEKMADFESKEKVDIASVENVGKQADIVTQEKVEKEDADVVTQEKVKKEDADVVTQEKVKKEDADVITQEKVEKEDADVVTQEKVEKEDADVAMEEKVEKEDADVAMEEKVEKEDADVATEEKVGNEDADVATEEKVGKEEADIASKEEVGKEETDTVSEEKIDKEEADTTTEH